jgi:UDP-N-acetylmuramoyl-tripeptide--D-alanyl-D-alanine ligase
LILKKIASRLLLEYLRFFAMLKLLYIKPRIVGVTGSVGKTSAISALHTIISPTFQTKTTFKGNSESGIPLEILGIKMKDYSFWSWLKVILAAPYYAGSDNAGWVNKRYKELYYFQVLIVEMGVDAPTEPKNMSYLLKIVKPDIGIILNVAPVHTEQFGGDVDAIAREKGLLVTTMEKNGTAIVNADDEHLAQLIPQIKAKVLTFGSSSQCSLQTTDYRLQSFSTKFEFKYRDKIYELNFKDKVFFREYQYIFAAAILAAKELGISIEDSIKRLEEKYTLPAGRLSALKGENNSTIIDSSYNASPAAMLTAINLLREMKTSGQKIAVLGDMRELGSLTQEKHEEVARVAIKAFDKIILVGPLMKKFAAPAILAAGFPENNLFQFNKSKGVGDWISNEILKENDLILVKGSQNTIFLEQVVYELMKEKTRVFELLCRQSDYWHKTRAKFFREN